MATREEWLASLKPGDEVAASWNGDFQVVARRTPKRIVLGDGRVFDAEQGELIGAPRRRRQWRARPAICDAASVRRRLRFNRLREAIGPNFADCTLSDETIARLCAVLDEASRGPR